MVTKLTTSYFDEDEFFQANVLNQIFLILDEFSTSHSFTFSEQSSQSLAIHLAMAVDRIQKLNPIEEMMLPSIDMSLTSQFQNAKNLQAMIENSFHILIPDSEINYIQLHLISAQNQIN